MQGLSPAAASKRDACLERIPALYGDGLTERAIAIELGISVPTAHKYVNRLAELGQLRKRTRSESAANGVQRFWNSTAGQQERERRSERLRRAPPVERVCEHCGERFKLSAKRARQEPGRYCSKECAREARAENLRSEVTRERLREGRRRWRTRVAEVKAATELLDLGDVIRVLRRERVPRSQPALSHSITKGWLAPTTNELGIYLFTEASALACAEYLRDRADGRSRRYNVTPDRPKLRGSLISARHGIKAGRREWGRANAAGAKAKGTKNGRPRGTFKLPPGVTAKRIYELSDRGLSQGQIAITLSRDDAHLTRTKVQRVLNARKLIENPSSG